MQHGLLIAFEGIDGAGTTTQVPLIAAWLRAAGHSVYTTAEPSQGPLGSLARQALRRDPALSEAALALLFAADRLDHLSREIEPHLRAGDIVLTDRYLLSSYAYQACALPLAWVQQLNHLARPPDASLFFRVSPQTAAQRRQSRGGPAEHFDATARQAQVAQLYEAALQLPGLGTVCSIDAEAAVPQVSAALQAQLQAHVLPQALRP
jgi:dTMP kinase